MKKASLLFLVSLLVLQVRSQHVKHVILITIDGFRPDFYLDAKWETPNIRGLMKDGAHTKGMNSVFPSMTYPSHTTIVTGVQPAKHGIFALVCPCWCSWQHRRCRVLSPATEA